MPTYILNPKTNLLIKATETTDKRKPHYNLNKAKVDWHDRAPMSTKSRLEKCPGCFLLPAHSKYNPSNRPKYPICTKTAHCQLRCVGIQNALRRARMERDVLGSKGYAYVVEKAKRLLNAHCT